MEGPPHSKNSSCNASFPAEPSFLPQDARHAAEEEIYTNLNQKIDQFLQLADYDWMAVEAGSKASDYLVDLIAFLRSTFAVFTHLPVSMSRNTKVLLLPHPLLSLLLFGSF